MFDIGFWELAVLAVIGLIVLGPERLPVVARTVGRWVAQARHYMSALTSELEKEVAADDIRREVREAREKIEAETRGARNDARRASDSVMRPLADDLNRDAAESVTTDAHARRSESADAGDEIAADTAETTLSTPPAGETASDRAHHHPASSDSKQRL